LKHDKKWQGKGGDWEGDTVLKKEAWTRSNRGAWKKPEICAATPAATEKGRGGWFAK